MGELTHLVAHGHRRPRSTRWVNVRQRGAEEDPTQKLAAARAAERAPHSPPLRRRMRLRARGARSAGAEPAEPEAPSADERGECSPRPRPLVPRSERPPLPAFSVRSPSWDPRDREPRAESEVPPERAERPRPPREAPRDPPREPRPRPSRRGDEPPRSSNTSASRPARVRLARGRRPVVPCGISRSVNRCGDVW